MQGFHELICLTLMQSPSCRLGIWTVCRTRAWANREPTVLLPETKTSVDQVAKGNQAWRVSPPQNTRFQLLLDSDECVMQLWASDIWNTLLDWSLVAENYHYCSIAHRHLKLLMEFLLDGKHCRFTFWDLLRALCSQLGLLNTVICFIHLKWININWRNIRGMETESKGVGVKLPSVSLGS